MGLRSDVLDLLACDGTEVRDRFRALVDDHGIRPQRRVGPRARHDSAIDVDALTDRGRDLVDRVRLLDDAPLGVTLTGPAYRDTPILYANRTFREITGYSLAALRGNNPRLLQGPRTEADDVADLREAVSIWEPVTVEVWNHRRDGTAFLNRVSLRPLPGDDGTVTHWAAVQATVDPADSE